VKNVFPSPFQGHGKAYLKVAEPTGELALRAYNATKRHCKAAVGYTAEFSLCYMKMKMTELSFSKIYADNFALTWMPRSPVPTSKGQATWLEPHEAGADLMIYTGWWRRSSPLTATT
jgi:hypothetical protein